MNLFVADPGWGWWIILYFYLGGIAGGAYFTATLIDLFGRPGSREVARLGYLVAFPLIVVCGLFLTVDLDQPQRFWHMLFKSEVVNHAVEAGWPLKEESWQLLEDAPLFKYWSPMSVGSWALTLFGLCSGLSFLGSLWPEGRAAWLLRRSLLARLLQLVGCAVGFFVASYTGALLTATNVPLWSDTNWVSPLFLTSAASSGISTLILLSRYRRIAAPEAWHGLARADLWALCMELVVFGIFVLSLGGLLGPVWATPHGKLLLAGVLGLGIALPLLLFFLPGLPRRGTVVPAAICVLAGGFLLRYSILTTPAEILTRGRSLPGATEAHGWSVEQRIQLPVGPISPEDDRPQGALGADPLNRQRPRAPADVLPRSKPEAFPP